MAAFQQAVASSRLVDLIRHLARGSIVCTAVVTIGVRYRRVRDHIAAALAERRSRANDQRHSEAFVTLLAESQLASAVSSLMAKLDAAIAGAASRRLLGPMVVGGPDVQLRAGGVALIVAVLTHAALFGAAGKSVDTLGWSFRFLVVAAGLVIVLRPEALVAAIRAKNGRTGL